MYRSLEPLSGFKTELLKAKGLPADTQLAVKRVRGWGKKRVLLKCSVEA